MFIKDKVLYNTMEYKERKCKKCGFNRFATHRGVLICARCTYPKTKRGIEKFKNLGILK